ncbi:hypothetical protein FRB94_005387 [Tulasnella sp. JGI-2019a]|nr:hypothetical protein FRB94_005387 [Tulasnella sp. JGI-2019a]KAG9024661.1 hypothetical protein FRB95_011234 [Tulasnella sp. JGI-2019a]
MQGGSVIKALAASQKSYRIRGFTRDTRKPAAKVLSAQGVEMINVSLTVDNKDHVFKVFQGADIVTNFWGGCIVGDGHSKRFPPIEEGGLWK